MKLFFVDMNLPLGAYVVREFDIKEDKIAMIEGNCAYLTYDEHGQETKHFYNGTKTYLYKDVAQKEADKLNR